MEFRDLVWKVLSNAIDKFVNIRIGNLVGDVVDVFQTIPEAMDNFKGLLVMLINKIKNETLDVVNTGIRKSIKGVETSVNLLSGKLDDGVISAVGGLNHVKNKLVGNLNKSINGMVSGIETSVNRTTGGIETAVNKSVGGTTDGINDNMNRVEKSLGRVMETTNDVIKGAEIAVNTISCKVNKALNKVEDGVNSVTKRVNSAVNNVLVPVNATVKITKQVRDGIIPVLNKRPFRWIRVPGEVKTIDIDEVEIPTISVEEFGRIKENLNIPDIPFDNINIPSLGIPTVNIKAPADLKEIDIPDNNIPSVAIPTPRDVSIEHFELPSVPGFGFITGRVEKVK